MNGTGRPHYIVCIASTNNKKVSWCGRYIGMEFAFVDKEHADNTINFGSRLLPCKECLKVMREHDIP
jgi:hypothetical protein